MREHNSYELIVQEGVMMQALRYVWCCITKHRFAPVFDEPDVAPQVEVCLHCGIEREHHGYAIAA
jgi:hypothetical protein